MDHGGKPGLALSHCVTDADDTDAGGGPGRDAGGTPWLLDRPVRQRRLLYDVYAVLKRTNERNWLAAIAAVGQKITIRRENKRVPVGFRHPHQAGIGERHWHSLVAFKMTKDRGRILVVRRIRGHADQPVAQQCDQGGGPAANV